MLLKNVWALLAGGAILLGSVSAGLAATTGRTPHGAPPAKSHVTTRHSGAPKHHAKTHSSKKHHKARSSKKVRHHKGHTQAAPRHTAVAHR
jgi:hypothetical protein